MGSCSVLSVAAAPTQTTALHLHVDRWTPKIYDSYNEFISFGLFCLSKLDFWI